MKRLVPGIGILVLSLLVAACGPAAVPAVVAVQLEDTPALTATATPTAIPTATPTATPTSTATPTPTSTHTPTPGHTPTLTSAVGPGWVPAKRGEDLAKDASWGLLSEIDTTGGKLFVVAGESWATPINRRIYLTISSDFTVSASVQTTTANFGGMSLYGTLPQGDWWEGTKRLDVGLTAHAVGVSVWTGSSADPIISETFTLHGSDSPAHIQVRKEGTHLVIWANAQTVGQIEDPGLFAEGKVYFGLNCAPGNRLTVSEFTAAVLRDQAPHQSPGTATAQPVSTP